VRIHLGLKSSGSLREQERPKRTIGYELGGGIEGREELPTGGASSFSIYGGKSQRVEESLPRKGKNVKIIERQSPPIYCP